MNPTMKAAVVYAFDAPPRYGDFDVPVARGDDVLVTVSAAALSQLVRAQASGKHYSSATHLPFVPGADGVGKLDDGRRVYFAFPTSPIGSMAERVAVRRAYVVELPADLDDVTAAAAGNPGMSSWASLTRRAILKRGEAVLINGATGAAGRLAIQVARHLGAGRIVATGRNPSSEAALRELGADAFIAIEQSADALMTAFRHEIEGAGIDIVLDYLWGPSAGSFIAAASSHGTGEAARRIRYVNIGSLAGASIALPAGPLRSSGLELLGSGLGSLSHTALVESIGEMLRAFKASGFQIDADPTPLADVESAWANDKGGRIVFTM